MSQKASAPTSLQSQLPNIAPAPQGTMPQNMPQHPMAPATPQTQQAIMANGQQMTQVAGQPLQAGQFQVIQQPFNATPGTTPQYQYIIPGGQVAGQPQQGVFAMPAGMQMAAPQTGQPQYFLTGMTAAAAPGQKPGQPTQMIVSPAQPNASGKPIAPMSQGYTISSTGLVTATPGGATPQTIIMASPMGGMQPQQPGAAVTSMASQMKQADQKPPAGLNQQQMAATPQPSAQQQPVSSATPATPQTPVMLPQGMTYMNMSPQQGQAFLQNGQLIFRPAAPQDPNSPATQTPLMFSPTAQPLAQQAPGQAMAQQITSQASAQPMPMSAANTVRPPTALQSTPTPPGKTPISRNLPPLLPTGINTTRPGYPVNMPNIPGLGANTQVPSPKSKPKMSPRGGTGQVGRPPGPAKTALNNLKTPTATMSPPRLPGSPGMPANPQLLGPPVLQTSSGSMLPPQPPSSLYSQPPKLQPMLPTTTSMNMSSKPGPASKKSPQKNVINTSTVPKDTNGTADKESENTPKAVVKPNVLTHIIDGHVIEESSQPFPVDKDDKGRLNKISMHDHCVPV